MTNLDARPEEVVCAEPAAAAGALGAAAPVQVLTPRDVPLGGLRSMTVRRTLPQRDRSLIGAWCFADHYGPDDVEATGGMDVPPHPHTGLQTVSWLFSGEVEHRDSLGTHAVVRPGELNLMTAGRGIAHSETSTAATTVLHGVQLWTALPSADRDVPPAFVHHVPETVELPGGQLRVFLGSLAGATSPVTTFSALLGAELRLEPGAVVTLDLDPEFEHGVLVDAGPVVVDRAGGPAGDPGRDRGQGRAGGTALAAAELGYLAPGRGRVTLSAPPDAPALLLLLGGAPLGERLVMWWNFVGPTHEAVVAARVDWHDELGGAPRGRHAARRFGVVPGYPGAPLPAPELPGTRLLPRG